MSGTRGPCQVLVSHQYICHPVACPLRDRAPAADHLLNESSIRSRLAFLEVAMTEPSARPSASRTRAFFTEAQRQVKAWPTCKQPETQTAASSPPRPVPPDPASCPQRTCVASPGTHRCRQQPTLTWVLNGHHLKATRLNPAPLPLHRCWWPVGRRREHQSLGSSPPHSPELQENIQTALLSPLTSPHHCCCHRHRCSAQPVLHQHQLLCLLQAEARPWCPPGEPSSSALSSLLCLGRGNQWAREG